MITGGIFWVIGLLYWLYIIFVIGLAAMGSLGEFLVRTDVDNFRRNSIDGRRHQRDEADASPRSRVKNGPCSIRMCRSRCSRVIADSILLHVDEMGKEKCVACYLCAAACPSDCIYIEAENDPRPYEERIGRDERYAKVYNIDYGRCIFCGFCVEACPKDAITHGYNFEISVYNRADLLKTKDDLLITKQKQSKNYRVALSSEDVDSEYKEV